MIKRTVFFLIGFLVVVLLATSVRAVSLEDCENGSKDSACIELLQAKIDDLGSQKKTLSSQIAQFNSQIQVTQLKIGDAETTIQKLEKEIGALGARIGYINQSVDRLGVLLKQRIVATYQQSFVSDLELVLTSKDFSDLVLRLQYLKAVQENDKKLLTSLQETKSNYANQKDEREEKQAAIEASKRTLEALKLDLDQQKVEKEVFLKVTQNDESRYQSLLAQAQAELAVSFGGGDESYLRDVSEGESIGSIASMSVSAGCSSGPHLHFEVHNNGSIQDPNNYLRETGISYNYPDSYQSVYGTVNPHGPFPWPINEPIGINQGFVAQKNSPQYGAAGHLGIDMQTGSTPNATGQTIKAIKSGKLYGGSYNCSNGKLFYAKIDHGDGLTTWYLHMVPS